MKKILKVKKLKMELDKEYLEPETKTAHYKHHYMNEKYIQALEIAFNILKDILVCDVHILVYRSANRKSYIYKRYADNTLYIKTYYYDDEWFFDHEFNLDEILKMLKEGDDPWWELTESQFEILMNTIDNIVFNFDKILETIKRKYEILKLKWGKDPKTKRVKELLNSKLSST